MKVLRLIPVFAFVGTLFANGQPAPKVSEIDTAKSFALEGSLGFMGGYQYFGGKKDLTTLDGGNVVKLMTHKKIREHSAKVALFAGIDLVVPNSKFRIGLEANGAYSKTKSKDFNSILILGVLESNRVSKWKGDYSVGLNLKPAYRINENNGVYALLGVEMSQFKFVLSDSLGIKKLDKKIPALTLGLGYEYTIKKNSIGIRYQASLYKKKSFTRIFGGEPYKIKLDPLIHAFMLTYRYSV